MLARIVNISANVAKEVETMDTGERMLLQQAIVRMRLPLAATSILLMSISAPEAVARISEMI